MRLITYRIFQYSLPFIKPLVFKTKSITNRDGIILILKFDNEIEGIGEIAPLPGFSKTSIRDCLDNLKIICNNLIRKPLNNISEEFFKWLDNSIIVPEVQFGIEMAVYNAMAIIRNLPLCKFISETSSNEVILNGLVQGDKSSVSDEAISLLQKGFKLIKVKATGNVEEDINIVTSVIKTVENYAKIHIDANQKWTFDDALLFAKKIDTTNIIYIEEPFSEISRIAEFFKETKIPVALDESLALYKLDFLLTIKGVEYIVIKPTFLGGIRKTLCFINKARKTSLRPVISSFFESGIGINTLIHIAAGSGQDITLGIDTLKYFERDLLKKALEFNSGKVVVPQNISINTINFINLREV